MMLYLMRHGQDDPTVRGGWSCDASWCALLTEEWRIFK